MTECKNEIEARIKELDKVLALVRNEFSSSEYLQEKLCIQKLQRKLESRRWELREQMFEVIDKGVYD